MVLNQIQGTLPWKSARASSKPVANLKYNCTFASVLVFRICLGKFSQSWTTRFARRIPASCVSFNDSLKYGFRPLSWADFANSGDDKNECEIGPRSIPYFLTANLNISTISGSILSWMFNTAFASSGPILRECEMAEAFSQRLRAVSAVCPTFTNLLNW